MQIKCLGNGLYLLKNSHKPFGKGFQPPVPPLRQSLIWTLFLWGLPLLIWDQRKGTWGGEFLGPGLDNRGELDWDLPQPAAANLQLKTIQINHDFWKWKSTLNLKIQISLDFKNGDQPEPVTLGLQRRPPCPQQRDNTPLETAPNWNWNCTKLRNWNCTKLKLKLHQMEIETAPN